MNNRKSLIIPRVTLHSGCTCSEIALMLQQHGARVLIDSANWQEQYPVNPLSTLQIAHDGKALYARFTVDARFTRATTTADLGPVADDTCFEIFVKHPGAPRYWNFEFNTLGLANVSSRTERKNPTRFTPDELAKITRYGSTLAPHDTTEATGIEELTVVIPLSLIGVEQVDAPMLLEGNFYSCAAGLPDPYFLSWSPIESEKPNYHCPEQFGYLILE